MKESTQEIIIRACKLSLYGQKRCFQAEMRIAFDNGKDHEKVIELMHKDMDNDHFCKTHNLSEAEMFHLWIDEKIRKGEV